jgi:hypothetical protein
MTTAGGRRDEQITDHRYVTVDGNRAAWLFAEFETSRSLSELTRWLTPQDWPQWGGTIFKEMKPIGKRKPGRSGYEWQAKYLEVVNLAGQELNTVLRCDFGRTAKWAAMTYDLDHSVDNMLQVDRGFLLAVEAPNKRRQVKALKVVGFTNPFETFVVEEMGGQWTGWIRDAIKLAAKDGDRDPSIGHHRSTGARVTVDSASDYYQDWSGQWTECVNDMAQFYGGYASDVGSRLWSGQYNQGDAGRDGGRLFLRLARDWSRLCRAGSQMAADFADADVPSTGGARPTTEYTDVLVSAPAQRARVSVGDLVKVGLEDTTLKPSHIELGPETVGTAPDPATIRLEVDPRRGSSGLYVGDLTVNPGGTHPAFVYISKARPVA